MYSIVTVTSFTSQPIFHLYILHTKNRETGKSVLEINKYGMVNLGENIIIIWILDKSRSVAPAKLEIKLVSP